MKKLLAFSLIGSSLILGTSSSNADWDYWAINLNPDASNKGYDIYTVDNDTGQATLRTTKCFDLPNYSGQC